MGSSTFSADQVARPSQRLPITVQERLPQRFVQAIDFHGHLCPGLTMGYRAAVLALDHLSAAGSLDEELLGIVENDACGVDAFQFLTGCTLGKGNLVFKDYGKQVFTLVRRSDGWGARVAVRSDRHQRDPRHRELRERVMAGQASDEERQEFQNCHIDTALRFLELSDESFARVTDAHIELPSKARIFDSVTCAVCGESTMEPRVRMRDGEPCCIPCAIRYGRGWEINS